MKLAKGRIGLATLLLLGCSAPLDREPPREGGTRRETATAASDLDQLVQDTIRTFSSFPQAGIAVGVVKDGQVIFARGYGLRDWGAGLPASPSTRFAIGSNTKSFTALGLALLKDRGRFDFDVQINAWLPDFRLIDPVVTSKLTPADLLSHRSGLARHDLMAFPGHYTRNEIVSRMAHLEMDNRSGYGYHGLLNYNNLAFVAAGTISEALTGLTWEDYTRQQILAPLGMTSTSFSMDGLAGNPEAALEYNRDGTQARLVGSTQEGPAGSINSTVEDMLKYLQLYLSGGLDASGRQLIAPATLLGLFSLRTVLAAHTSIFGPDVCFSGAASCFNYYGLGWALQYDGTTTLAYHGGHYGGYYSFMSLLGSRNLGVVVLNNVDHNPAVLAIGRAINQYFLAGPGAPPGPPILFPPPVTDTVPVTPGPGPLTTAATFTHAAYGDVQLVSDGANLYLKYFEIVSLIVPTSDPNWVAWLPLVSPTAALKQSTLMYLDRGGVAGGPVLAIYPFFESNAISRFVRR